MFQKLVVSTLVLLSCDTGKLTVVADIPSSLKEVSAVEVTSKSNLIWVIEDAGNTNHLYGLDKKGTIKKDLAVLNSKNHDWEDLTSDAEGNLYIGDFGNNSHKRKGFSIYKVNSPEVATESIKSEKTSFVLPEGMKSKNFEAFFLYKDNFYLFSKEAKRCVLLKVPNVIGAQKAELVTEFNLEGKYNLITSADISDDGNIVVLLNHDKVWKLTNFYSDNFFEGKIEALPFNHNTQKEGVCFENDKAIYITDENNANLGSNLYEFKLIKN